MEHFMIMYWKEVKNMSRGLLIILALHIVAVLVSTFSIFKFTSPLSPFEMFIIRLPEISFYLFPALLVHSLYIEERSGTLYQGHSLPVERRKILRVKFLVVLGAMAVFIPVGMKFSRICRFVFEHFLTYSMAVSGKGSPRVVISGIHAVLSYPFISLCLVCAFWGVMHAVKMNRLVLGLAIVVAGIGMHKLRLKILEDFYQRFSLDMFLFSDIILTLVVGALFSCIGFYLYEKYADV